MKSYHESGLANNPRGSDPAPAPNSIAAGADAPLIEDTIRCLGCGYDLRAMREDARCPECYFDIRESIRPEVRGFGGLMMLQRFRLALWMLAALPLVLLFCGALKVDSEFRFRLIDAAAGPRPPVPNPSSLGWSAQWHRYQAFTNQPYRQRWEEMSAALDVLLLLFVAIITATTLILLCTRDREASTVVNASLKRPRTLAVRTAAIAFGIIVALTPIPLAITWQLTWTWTDSMLGPLGILVPLSVWLIAAAFGWWAVSRVTSGRVRIAFASAAAALLLGGALTIGGNLGLPVSPEIAHTIVYAGLALLALGAGLLWRWYAVGFTHPELAAFATGFAGAAPALIVLTCGALDPTISAGLLEIRPSFARLILVALVIWACVIGVPVAWGVSATRKRIL
ncbi:MAG: hypothetical protein ACTS3F_00730 [Phycisphaerales bacterium]